MRGLDEEQLRVLGEVADRLGQERAEGHVVGVEHHHDRAPRVGQPVVEVAGLGVLVARPGQVAAAEVGAERLQFGPAGAGGGGLLGRRVGAFLVGAAVVEQPDGELVGRVVHLPRGREGHRQDRGVLVVARHEDVDGGQIRGRRGRRRPAPERLGIDDQAHEEDEDAVQFADEQQQPEAEADRVARRGQGVGDAPQDVAQHHQAPHRQEDEAAARPIQEEPEPDHRRHRGEAHGELVLRADRLAQQDEAGRRHPHPGQPPHRPHHASRSKFRNPLITRLCRFVAQGTYFLSPPEDAGRAAYDPVPCTLRMVGLAWPEGGCVFGAAVKD